MPFSAVASISIVFHFTSFASASRCKLAGQRIWRSVKDALSRTPVDNDSVFEVGSMLRPQIQSTESGADQWALGWGIQQEENGDVIRHGGSNPGFQTLVAASVQSKSGFVIATNGDNELEVIKQIVSGDRMKRFLHVRV